MLSKYNMSEFKAEGAIAAVIQRQYANLPEDC